MLAVVLAAAVAVPVLSSELPGFRQGLWRLDDTHFAGGEPHSMRHTACTDPTSDIRATLTPMRLAMCRSVVMRKDDAFETTTTCGDNRTVITITPRGDSAYTKNIVGYVGTTTNRETVTARRIGDCTMPVPPIPPVNQPSSGGL